MYIVAYDICDPKRLRRVARLLEKHALRCQKSVFVFRGTAEKLREVLDEIAELIDVREDLVQAWRLAAQEHSQGQQRGTPAVLYPEAAVVDGDQLHLIQERGA